MKSNAMPVTERLDETKNENSTNQQQDKKVTDNKQVFTAVDMWNRNRNSRSASDRFRKWNLN